MTEKLISALDSNRVIYLEDFQKSGRQRDGGKEQPDNNRPQSE
jgi:hypothetical protein